MREEELMIGDLVYERLAGKDRVVRLNIDAFAKHYDELYRCYGYEDTSFGRLVPIPLTSEFLEKNGYEFVEDSMISISAAKLLDDYTSISFQFCNNKDCYFQLHHCGAGSYEIRKYIKYVHQLQHILRECGLEEMANKFEI